MPESHWYLRSEVKEGDEGWWQSEALPNQGEGSRGREVGLERGVGRGKPGLLLLVN